MNKKRRTDINPDLEPARSNGLARVETLLALADGLGEAGDLALDYDRVDIDLAVDTATDLFLEEAIYRDWAHAVHKEWVA